MTCLRDWTSACDCWVCTQRRARERNRRALLQTYMDFSRPMLPESREAIQEVLVAAYEQLQRPSMPALWQDEGDQA